MTSERSRCVPLSRISLLLLTALLWSGCGTDGAPCEGISCGPPTIVTDESCAIDEDCPVGRRCTGGSCIVSRNEECVTDGDCGPRARCESGACFPVESTEGELDAGAGAGADGGRDAGPSPDDAGTDAGTDTDTGTNTGCNGCRSEDDSCHPGTDLAACGEVGGTCLPCFPGQECTAGDCVIPASSRWDLRAVRAELPYTNASGQSWDPSGGLPDPFIRVEAGTTTTREGESNVLQDTLEPGWDEVLLDGVSAAELREQWLVRIFDVDGSQEERISNCGVLISDERAVFSGNLFLLRCTAYDDVKSATYWRLTPD